MPNCQQIGFHSVLETRAQTSFASSGSSQRSQSIASSASLMARGDGRGRRISGSWPTLSAKVWKYSGQAEK